MNDVKIVIMIEKIKRLATKEKLTALLIALIIVQPIIDMDGELYRYLDPLGIPLPSTLVFFIGMPLVFVLAFFILEKNKKRTFIFSALYGGSVLVYFVLHHLITKDMFELLYLSNRYTYTFNDELRYVLTLFIPFGLIYAFFKSEINQSVFDKIVFYTSILIAFPLFFSNLLLMSPATYYNGPTLANFPTWFFGIYDTFQPKQLASKFYFSEGNTTGIILFSLFPLLINGFYKSEKTIKYVIVMFIHGAAMLILGTRVGTYGAALMLAVTLVVWIFLASIKKVIFNWKKHLIVALLTAIFYVSLPYTPAVKNIEIDVSNNTAVWEDEYLRMQFKDDIANDKTAQALVPGTAEFDYYYQYIFKQYYWLLPLSDIYWKLYYPYIMDAKFYVDYIFEVDFYDRINARQFEKYFFDYKWQKLDSTQKLFGFGYSRFMWGSIVLEQDFVMQSYTLGYIGAVLLTGPWIVLLFWIVYKALRKFNQIFDPNFITLGVAYLSMLGGAYLSGHILDQFFSTTFMALYVAMMLKFVYFNEGKEN